MMKKILQNFCLALGVPLLLSLTSVYASTDKPQDFIEIVFNELVADLKATGESPSASDIQALFDEHLNPHIDYPGLARWTLRDYWQASTVEQRQAFLQALQQHVIKTYASAISFDDSTALALDDDVILKNNTALINGQLSAGGQSTAIEFRLVNQEAAWRLFDVRIGGISIAKTLRADFQTIAAAGGIDAVTRALSSGNLVISQR